MLGIFSGYSEEVILQDIWANLLFYNMESITHLEANLRGKQISQKRKNKPCKNKKKENFGYLSSQSQYWGSHFTNLLV